MADEHNLNEVLRESHKPALILPYRNAETHKADPIYLFSTELIEIIDKLTQEKPLKDLKPNDRVVFLFPNSVEFVAVFFAILKVQATACPLNPNYTVDELDFYLNDLLPKAVIIPKGASPASREAANKLGIPLYEIETKFVEKENVGKIPMLTSLPVELENKTLAPWIAKETEYSSKKNIALFLHTSGTTGRPKGVPLTHHNIFVTLKNIKDSFNLTPKDTYLLVMPLFHVHGLIGVLLTTLYAGGSVVVPPKFSATTFWMDFVEFEATCYSAVPTIHQILLLKREETYPGKEKTTKLRFIISCSSSLAPATLKELEESFNAPVIESYAMSEAAHQMTCNFLPPGVRKAGPVGKGRGVAVVIMDDNGNIVDNGTVGEVCVAGENVITEYYNNPTATENSFFPDPTGTLPNGLRWFRTGDLGYKDKDDFIFLTGRIKEQINRGGEKISPIEIDQYILQLNNVAEVCTFGVSSEIYGQEIECAVVAKDDSLTEQQLTEHCKAKLAAFKVPKRFWIVKEIPKTATGKVQRRVVSQHFEELAKQEAK